MDDMSENLSLPENVGFLNQLNSKCSLLSIIVMSKKFNEFVSGISIVNCNLVWKELNICRMSGIREEGAAISSTYLMYNGMWKGKRESEISSNFSMTISAKIGDRGEPIGVPKICL